MKKKNKCSKFHNRQNEFIYLSQRGFWTIRDSSSNKVFGSGDPPDIAVRIISAWVKPCCPGLCLPNETPCPWFLSVLRLARPLLLHQGKRRRVRRRRRGRGGNESKRTPSPPSHIICMCRIRNDIHREAVKRESWGTTKKKKEKGVLPDHEYLQNRVSCVSLHLQHKRDKWWMELATKEFLSSY